MKKCDTLILGNIYTLDTDSAMVEAMAIKDGRVVYVGHEEVARQLCDENTNVLDYKGKFVYPGFFDSHTHGLLAGQRLKFQCDLKPGNSMQDYVDIMKKYIEDNPGRRFYLGAGWIKYEEPTAAMLDSISKDIPIALNSADGHSMWVNSAVLNECGIDANKVKEFGSDQIHADENGNPTGLLCESASFVVNNKYTPSKEDIKEGLMAWQDFAFKNGITACVEALGDAYSEAGLEAYDELAKEGKLKLRTYAYTLNKKILMSSDLDTYMNTIKKQINNYNSEYFKVQGAKFLFDGVVEAHTAYLIDGYSDDPEYHGVNSCKGQEEFIKELITTLNANDIPVHIHTIGDGAVRLANECLEKSAITNLNFKVKNSLAHLQIVKPEDIKKVAEYGTIAVVAPLWVPVEKNYFIPEVEYLGEDRAYNSYPIKSFCDNGATICYHTDYPVTAIVNYPKTFYIASKRRDPEKGAKSFKNPDESISQIRSLLAVTCNGAYMVDEQDNLGKLLPGMIADCTVFDIDMLDPDIEKVPHSKLVATIIDGKVVYDSSNN